MVSTLRCRALFRPFIVNRNRNENWMNVTVAFWHFSSAYTPSHRKRCKLRANQRKEKEIAVTVSKVNNNKNKNLVNICLKCHHSKWKFQSNKFCICLFVGQSLSHSTNWVENVARSHWLSWYSEHTHSHYYSVVDDDDIINRWNRKKNICETYRRRKQTAEKWNRNTGVLMCVCVCV